MKRQSGFSYVELIAVLFGIVILGTIAVASITKIREKSLATGMESNVGTLNSAVKVYLANGGQIDNSTNIETVLTKLKSVSSTESEGDMAFAGPFVDLRLKLSKDFNSPIGVRWNSSSQEFEVDHSSERYIVTLADVPDEPTEEVRNGPAYKWGENWIWSYVEPDKPIQNTPTTVSLTPPSDSAPTTYTGPVVTVNSTTVDSLSIGLNSANNPGFETDNGIDDRINTWGGSGLIAYTTDQDNVAGWNTTASDGQIELWQSGFSGVDSYSGDYHAEFNAHEVSALWQEVDVAGFDVVKISFAHGQRQKSTEQLMLLVGTIPPPSKSHKNEVQDLASLGFVEVMTTNTNAVKGWKLYEDEVGVPEGEDKLYFAFQSVGEFATNSVGNFLDEVSFRGANIATLEGIGVDIGAGNSISNVVQSAKIILEDAEVEDQLELNDDLPPRFSVETAFVGGGIELTVTGEAFRHEYEEIIEMVKFSTTSDETHTRKMLFYVNDGYAISSPVEYLIDFE